MPFDMARGVFWLGAVVICSSIVMALMSAGTCMVIAIWGLPWVAKCDSLGLKDFFVEILATLMVLLNAKSPPK